MIKVLVKNVLAANDHCGYCERDFRRVNGIHVPSQRKGMIPESSCERVFAAPLEGSIPAAWAAFVDGKPLLLKKTGTTRRFPTALRAWRAACRAAPRGGHE